MGRIGRNVATLPESARTLLEPHHRLGIPVPAYAGRSLPNVMSSIVRGLGTEPGDSSLPPLSSDLDPFAGRRAEGPVILLLADGLGYLSTALTEREDPVGPLPSWTVRARPITSVFPTTTTVALTSLSTASAPSRHGIVGHREYFPQYGSVVDVLRMSPIGVPNDEALVGRDWTPDLVSGVPTVFRSGLSAEALSRDRFDGTAFTRLLYDGAPFHPYASFADLAHRLRTALDRDAPPPLILVYWDDLDTIQHLYGPRQDLIDFGVAELGRLLEFVSRGLPRSRRDRTVALLTADHGLVPADPDQQVRVERTPSLLEHLERPPSGDRRAACLRARPGHAVSLRRALSERLPEGSRVLEVAEAVDGGLFGPPPYHPELLDRLGDLVVLVPSPAGVTYIPPGRPSGRRELLGAHGGLEPEELLVPLVAGSLSELTDGERSDSTAPPAASGHRLKR